MRCWTYLCALSALRFGSAREETRSHDEDNDNSVHTGTVNQISIESSNPFFANKYPSKTRARSTSRSLSSSECPSEYNDEDDDFSKEDEYSTTAHLYSAYSKGDMGTSFVRRVRNRSPEFYQKVINKAIAFFCPNDERRDRCVSANSTFAAKNWEEECIVASDELCPEGTCERTSNCYWNTIVPNQPRTTRFPPAFYDAAEASLIGLETDKSYVRSVAVYAVGGTVVGAVLLFLWVLFFVGRYCCCCLHNSCAGICFLCSPVPRQKGYRVGVDLALPLLLYVAATVAIAAAAGLAFVGNEDISSATTDTFRHSSHLVNDLSDFLLRLRRPLVNVDAVVVEAANDARGIFNNTDYVADGAVEILDAFAQFGSLHEEGLDQSGARNDFASAFEGFRRRVRPVVDEVQIALDTLEIDVYDKAGLIKDSVSSAVDSVDSFLEITDEYLKAIYDVEGHELGIRPMRKASVMCLFLLSLVFTVVGLVGAASYKITGKSSFLLFFNVIGFLCAVLGCLVLVLASIALSLNALWYDACEIADVVVQDFEPYVGDRVAPGANACFNDNSNLADAFNMSDKVDFQARLDESLAVLSDVNVTERFRAVVGPLENVQKNGVERISDTALILLNAASTGAGSSSDACPFDVVYDKDTAIAPWKAHHVPPDRVTTEWMLNSTLDHGEFQQLDLESPHAYMKRVYTVAGSCVDGGPSCCSTTKGGTVCGLAAGADCNTGDDCALSPCSALTDNLLNAYSAYWRAFVLEMDMASDLGVSCPDRSRFDSENYRVACPATPGFARDLTLVGLLDAYRDNVTSTTNGLVDTASTSVGDVTTEVRDFLCRTNVSFVGRRYTRIERDVCVNMFGGVAQIHWALWTLAICLQIVAILSHVLSVRLRGLTVKQARLEQEYGMSDYDGIRARSY